MPEFIQAKMVSYKINVQDDERFTRVTGSSYTFYVIVGLMFLTLQVMLIPPFLIFRYPAKGDLLAFVLLEFFFCIIFYVICSWCPFYFIFEKDKQKGHLTFFSAPGSWRKKSFLMLGVSGLLVEDMGDWLARLYVLANKKHLIYSGYIDLVQDIAAKAGKAFHLNVEYQ